MKQLESHIHFYNYSKDRLCKDIWLELESGLWQSLDIKAYLYNNNLQSSDIHKSKPIFPHYHQVIPGTKWDNKINKLCLNLYEPEFTYKFELKDFLDLSYKYLENLNANRIGVHLSGGLDSGLIISILKFLNIPFVAIGLKSNNYEFRTERKIQDKFLEWGIDGLLIDMEEYPFFSDLLSKPIHQIPDADIKSIASTRALAKAFSDKGCDVVLTGQGGDSLFVQEINSINDISFNIEDEFLNLEIETRYYKPLGIKLVSFFSNKDIINLICSARLGQKEDILKLWLRSWAKEILPSELSEFTYCTDFFGQTMQGLNKAKPVINILMNEAYELTGNNYFSPLNIRRFLQQDVFSFEYKNYIQYCGLISVACWFHSFFNNKMTI